MKVLVTGAAGYIGGQTLLQLTDAGHDVLAIDRVMPPGHLMTVPCSWHTGDFASDLGLDAIKLFCPDAIIHCAGTSLVGPSIADPEEYYNNNFVKTKILLDFLVDNHYKKVRFVFSSSAATYGNPIITPVSEVDPTDPISPYGQSKLMIDWMLQSYHRAYGLDYVSFRYFNACGADPQARHGQHRVLHTSLPEFWNPCVIVVLLLCMEPSIPPKMEPVFEITFTWLIWPVPILPQWIWMFLQESTIWAQTLEPATHRSLTLLEL